MAKFVSKKTTTVEVGGDVVFVDETWQLVSKKTTTAPVWQHFEFEAGERGTLKNVDEATCKQFLKLR